jgi:TolA-binding protein
MTVGTHERVLARLTLVLAALTLTAAGTRAGTARAPGAEEAPATLREIGDDFEEVRLLAGGARSGALAQAQQSLDQVLRGGVDGDQRAAARFLSGAIAFELGDYANARDQYRQAADGLTRGPFADDAAFAAIQALEAAGDDPGAAREWARWEKRYPQSPLMPIARLKQAWNALRRGDVAAGQKLLTTLAAGYPWLTHDARFTLAQATAAWQVGRPADALAVLGKEPGGATALYLRALCLQKQGSLLKAAAAFQQVAERYPESPLRDPALLAKANTFLIAHDHRSAAEEFARVSARTRDNGIRAEADLRCAGSVFLAGAVDSALVLLRTAASSYTGTDVAARAQFLIGEALVAKGDPAQAIVEFNRVLSTYFQHKVAASAQYRVARCLDQLGRRAEATGSYQAVVTGYPLEAEAPAAAYLAGVGLMDQHKPMAAAPYFQLVLDRYARLRGQGGQVVFASPQHQELVEAALCLLEYCYHQAGDLGQLSGAPHLLLAQMPPSHSPWRAYALLIDADASASQARYPEAQATLEQVAREFPDHPVASSATKLLAWTYARQGRDSLAIATEERLLARYGATGSNEILAAAFLDIAHERFNQKRYREAAGAYEDYLRRFPGHSGRLLALYQDGLCYLRLDRAGDAADRWEAIVRDSASAPLAERAWARAGDIYFQAERYDDARRCYRGLLEHFAGSAAASLASLRLAQCEYNAGRDTSALAAFSTVIERYPGTPSAREAARGSERAMYRLSQGAKGAEVLSRLVEQYPTSAFAADAEYQIGKRLYQEKRFREAADHFRRVVSQFPGYSAADQAQFLIADAYAQAGSGDEARQAYEQFLAYFPSSELAATVHFRLGLMRFEAKDYMQAAVAFTRAIDDSAAGDVRAASRYNLALCQRLLGQTADAREALEHYAQDYPGDARAAEVAFQLGDLADLAGDHDTAAQQFDLALRSHPAASLAIELHYRLGRVREELGDSDGALAAYQGAVAAPEREHPFRLSALARSAALYEARKDKARALTAYRDIMRNAKDPELVAAASDRVSQLEAGARKR